MLKLRIELQIYRSSACHFLLRIILAHKIHSFYSLILFFLFLPFSSYRLPHSVMITSWSSSDSLLSKMDCFQMVNFSLIQEHFLSLKNVLKIITCKLLQNLSFFPTYSQNMRTFEKNSFGVDPLFYFWREHHFSSVITKSLTYKLKL